MSIVNMYTLSLRSNWFACRSSVQIQEEQLQKDKSGQDDEAKTTPSQSAPKELKTAASRQASLALASVLEPETQGLGSEDETDEVTPHESAFSKQVSAVSVSNSLIRPKQGILFSLDWL